MAQALKYTLRLLIGVLLTFVIHLGFRYMAGAELWEHRITAAYGTNFILAAAIMGFLILAPMRWQASLGFLFLAGSALKFVLFFLFFYPVYKQDGTISRPEFFTFFIPYALCLFFETQSVIRVLKERDR